MRHHLQAMRARYLCRRDVRWTRDLHRDMSRVGFDHSQQLFVFCQVGSSYYEKLYTLIAHELSKREIPACLLFKSDMPSSYSPKLTFNGQAICNSLCVKRHKLSITNEADRAESFEWLVDPGSKRIEAGGVNFFYLILGSFRSLRKRYNIDFEEEQNANDLQEMVRTCDLLFEYFLLLKLFARDNAVSVRIVGWESSYVPNGVFRILSEQLSEGRDIEYVDLARGYPHYFGHHFKESYVAAVNCTRAKVDSRLAISEDQFNEFRRRETQHTKVLASVAKVLGPERGAAGIKRAEDLIRLMREYRSNGRLIFVLFAHLFYDAPVCDESPAFEGMCEWITETVASFQTRRDLLLLKPHPAEVRPDAPQKAPNETLASFLGDAIMGRDNIVLLEPRQASVVELHPYISCGLVWRSSVAMELTYLRIPCIIAGLPPYSVLNLTYASSRNHYFDLIDRAHELAVSDEQVLAVARYIHYLKEHKHFHIRSLRYDRKSREHHWDGKRMQRYLRSGDEELGNLVDTIVA